MATSTRRERPARTLVVLGILVLVLTGGLLAGSRWGDATLDPKLALDLEGGTQIILTPESETDEAVTQEQISQAIEIIRQRVDASGVAEAEITSQGQGKIVVALPGRPSEETLDLVRESAQMLFRPVIAVGAPTPAAAQPTEAPTAPATDAPTTAPTDAPTGTPTAPADEVNPSTEDGTEDDAAGLDEAPAGIHVASAPAVESRAVRLAATEPTAAATPAATAAPTPAPTDAAPPATEGESAEPTDASDPAWATPEIRTEFEERDCTLEENLTGGADLVGDPKAAVVSCASDGTAKYILGPVEVFGEDVAGATSGLRVGPNGAVTNTWVVNIDFDGQGTDKFRDVTARLLNLEAPRNQFAMVLDGLVISAPSVNAVINDGNAEISGTFTQDTAATLSRQLNFGALPLTFRVESEEQISATLGSEQLQRGLLAGLVGLLLVGVYSLFQYRALGLVTVASLLVAGVLTYLVIAYLSWVQGYRLSLPGVAGLIVAIGVTADSFIVYFERIRDELRDGRPLVAAVEVGWKRARRTILASDAVSFLAAVVLYFLAVGGVRGFAFTLGLTTLIDLLVVICFTHPLMAVLARTRFFGEGHRMSGLDPRALGARARYVGRGKVVPAEGAAARRPEARPGAAAPTDDDAVTAGAPRMTIAERRALRDAAAPSSDASTDGKDL